MRCWCVLLSLVVALPTHAFSWRDLWFTKDQQAQEMVNKGDFKQAKKTFKRNDWRAASAFRAKDYQDAAAIYQSLKNEEGYYNLANTLAHLGKYKEALAAYDKSLALNPKHQDALYNRKIIEELLKNQNKQNQNKQNQDKQNQDKQNQDKQQPPAGDSKSTADREKQQAKQQWLRLIPDDPGGLMREKFLRDHLRRQHGWNQ